MMLGAIVVLVVHAENERDVFAARRRGYQDFLCAAAVDVCARLGRIRKDAGRFNDEIDAERFPWQLGGIAFGDDLNRAAVDLNRVGARAYFTLEDAVIRIVLEQMRALAGAREIVDGSDLDVGIVLDQRFGEITADAAKAVDTNAHRIEALPSGVGGPLSGRLAKPSDQAHERSDASVEGGFADGRVAALPQFRQGFVGVCEPYLGGFAQNGR